MGSRWGDPGTPKQQRSLNKTLGGSQIARGGGVKIKRVYGVGSPKSCRRAGPVSTALLLLGPATSATTGYHPCHTPGVP